MQSEQNVRRPVFRQPLTRPLHCLVAAVLACLAAFAGPSLSPAAPLLAESRRESAPQQTEAVPRPATGAVICYSGSAAFFVLPPVGWVNDSVAADNLGVCAVYVPEGASFNDAPAIMYPRAAPRQGDTLDETVKALTGLVLRDLQIKTGGKGPYLRQGERFQADKGGEVSMVLFDEGPRPNEWEAAAYMIHKDAVLMLVLSARDKESRDACLPRLKDAMSGVVAMDMLIENKRQSAAE